MIPKSERAELYKIKKHKDLGFMLEIKQEKSVENIRKYLLKEGTGSPMCQMKIPISVYYSYEKYDYTGKLVLRTDNKNSSLPFVPKENEFEENNLCTAVQSMKLNQRSWFNIELFEKEATTCAGYNGYHYEIVLEKFTYKNDNNYESKKLIYQENRQKAKRLFQKQNYKEALKIYRHSINILSGLSKKFFNPQELKELREYCQKSQANFLKCLAKLNGFGGRYDKDIGKLAKQLVDKFEKKYPESLNSLYQRAIWLKYESKFSDGEDVVKQAFKKKFSQDPETAKMQKNALINMIEQIKRSKQRNIRHLRREEIRKRKAEKKNADVWDSFDEEQEAY